MPDGGGSLATGTNSDLGIAELIALAKRQSLYQLSDPPNPTAPNSSHEDTTGDGEAEYHRPIPSGVAPQSWVARIREAVKQQWSDPLSRGGLALVVNTAVTGALGFAYWIIAARLFSTYAVGIAGALVSATTLFSGIGQLNLSGMLMRFLPRAEGKSRRLVLVTYVYAAAASGLLASLSLLGIRLFASPRSPLRLDTIESAALVLAVTATAIFTIQDSVLVGLRRAIWVPVENGSFGIAKIVVLFVFAPLGTAFAVFGAWMIPLTLTIPVISAALFYRFLPKAPKTKRIAFGRRVRSKMIRFTVGDATGGLFTQAWTYLLPVVITASLGAPANALFFTSFLFSSTIDQVATNYASPLIVEGAHAREQIGRLIRSTLRHIFVIVFPAVAIMALISPWLLRAFGPKYVSAAPLMCLLLVACLPKAISAVYYAYCRVERTTHKSAVMQGYVCIATLSAVVLFGHRFGLLGIGYSILAVQISASLASWWSLRKGLRFLQGHDSRHGHHRLRRDLNVSAGDAIKLPTNER
jgi:O-antigen/teichoic acid export membrane protein